jgi:iron(III) transport system substrate-binding protein
VKGSWYAAVSVNVYGFVYNTKLVPPDKVPKSWDDLLDPFWKGQIGLDVDDQLFFAALSSHWGEAKAVEYFQKLVGNGAQFRKGHTLLVELTQAGEIYATPSGFNMRAEQFKSKGGPVDWVALGPAVAYSMAGALPKTTRNPHAALLFLDFLYSPKGQQLQADLQRVPARSEIKTKPERLALSNYEYIIGDPEKNARDYERINNLWQTKIYKP